MTFLREADVFHPYILCTVLKDDLAYFILDAHLKTSSHHPEDEKALT